MKCPKCGKEMGLWSSKLEIARPLSISEVVFPDPLEVRMKQEFVCDCGTRVVAAPEQIEYMLIKPTS